MQEDLDGDGLRHICDVDADGDGFTVDADCNDYDRNINPSVCDIRKDGIDQNCDGSDRTNGQLCPPEPTGTEGLVGTCSDEIDNDADGLTDCIDPDCSGVDDCQVLSCPSLPDKTSCQIAGCTWSNKDKLCL